MFFAVTNDYGYDYDDKKAMIRQLARRYVARKAMTPPLKKLSDYLESEIGKGLKEACIELIEKKIAISADNSTGEFIASFIDEESDDLAKLITYGNSEIRGCDILKKAFAETH